jgi:hypothetical protein
MTPAAWAPLVSAFRRAALPLGCYYTVTVLMPLANGAAQSGVAFLDHAVVVLIVPPVLILAYCVVDAAVRIVARTWRRWQAQYVSVRSCSFTRRSRTLGVANSAGFPTRSLSVTPRALLDIPDR